MEEVFVVWCSIEMLPC